ncbi:MAG: hypothetical protein QNK23_13730 [Crocinitomicaceae bacterium]|nr:hypothetical protein [Crocinitomicaceae bacterium]
MKSTITILTLIFLLIIITACNKKEGCTNPVATNYYADAEVDDQTCRYAGTVRFWVRESVWLNNQSGGIAPFVIDICGAPFDTIQSTAIYLFDPYCINTGTVDFDYDFKEFPSAQAPEVQYTVRDANNMVVLNKTVVITNVDCQFEEIIL